MSTSIQTTAPSQQLSRNALIGGSVGNFIEWYEFSIYGYFATVIAANFFSSGHSSPIEALIKTWAAFAIAFFFRPIGATMFGRLGDRIGRKPTLLIVLVLMVVSTSCIGLLPTYASVGVLAPILLTIVRMIQGLSAGGEFGGAVSLMTEFAPHGKRGLYGAWQSFTVALGLLAGALTAAILSYVMSESTMNSWGWRIPFLMTLPLGLIALYLRLKLEESPDFEKTTSTKVEAPVRKASTSEVAKAILLGVARLMGWSAAGYTFLVVMPSYLQNSVGTSFRQALVATVVANLGFAATILPAGAYSDKIGRKPVMLTGTFLIVVLALPLMKVLQAEHSSLFAKSVAVFVAGACVGLIAGPGPAMLSEMFPTSVRYTGLGLAYSLSNAVFSGSAGLIITSLISSTGNKNIPAYYVMITCAISFFALNTLQNKDRLKALSDDSIGVK
ncbi:MAG: MFS transporter [Micrococcaceae bacterium]